MKKEKLKLLQLQWGWITPGTGNNNKREQSDEHLKFLKKKLTPATKEFVFTHCGWWLDSTASQSVKDLTGKNPEPNRSLTPASEKIIRELAGHVKSKRLEFLTYPYAACVCEATTGEGLLRSIRFSRDLGKKIFGRRSRVALNHDYEYGLEWAAVQMPQIADILGFENIFTMSDGTVVSPDGTKVRIIGEFLMHDFLSNGYLTKQPIAYSQEMTYNLRMHNKYDFFKEQYPILEQFDVEAIGLDHYLKESKFNKMLDSTEIGAKCWYGGTIDSLLQEQNAKSVEVRLPAVEALAVLSGQSKPALIDNLNDCWKKSFILMDNHTLWQCHDYKAHYLGESKKLLEETLDIEADIISGDTKGEAVFNPVPWKRSFVVQKGNKALLVKNSSGWSVSAPADEAVSDKNDKYALTLKNDIVTYKLNKYGEISAMSGSDKRIRKTSPLGELIRIKEKKLNKKGSLKHGQTIDNFAGALSFTAEIDLQKTKSHQRPISVSGAKGTVYLVVAEKIDGRGKSLGKQNILTMSLHWSGRGLPKKEMNIPPKVIDSRGAAKLKITLYMLSEGSVSPGDVTVWNLGPHGHQYETINKWQVHYFYENEYVKPSKVKSEVIHSSTLMKTVRFTGSLPDLTYKMDISLKQGSKTLEYDFEMNFPKAVPFGLTTPPFSTDDGSLLGAQCERPYVPGVVVNFPLSGAAKYYADKPYNIQEVLQNSKRSWHTDVRDWYMGMSPFTGMNMACAESAEKQLGLFTRGIKHFMRWQRDGQESLALSCGSGLIHMATQGHSARKDSPYYDIIKRVDHDPYYGTKFLFAKGKYNFHYAICPEKKGEAGRIELWKKAREFALPATPVKGGSLTDGVKVSNKNVVITALEKTGRKICMRICNLKNSKVKTDISLPFAVKAAVLTTGKAKLKVAKGILSAELPPKAVREITLTL
ncbi:MAG: hypothetical protein ACYTFY_05010 [Planctomycetota bacterium]|jgi:hypothetical protein